MDWFKIADLAGGLLSKGAKSQADQRHNTDDVNFKRDSNQERATSDYNNAVLNREKYEDTRQQAAYEQALHSQMMQHWTPTARPHGVPTISFVPGGGPSAAMLDRSKDMERMATIKMLGGDALPEVERFQSTPMEQPSTLEKVLSFLGPATQGAGALGKILTGDDEDIAKKGNQ